MYGQDRTQTSCYFGPSFQRRAARTSHYATLLPEGLMEIHKDVELTVDAHATLGEGPIWDETANVLWWIDIKKKQLHRYDPGNDKNTTYDVGQCIGTVVRRASGGLMVAVEDGFATFDPTTETLEVLTDPEADQPGNRFNDGKCDPEGRFWAGTMEDAETGLRTGALYSLDTDGSVCKHFDGIGVSNGLVWTADAKTFYYIDSPTRSVDAFDYDRASGSITNRHSVFRVPDGQGYPDGMTIDSEDKLWVCLWEGWGVLRIDPTDGSVLARIEVPVERVTACAFGGADLNTLYMTTASIGVDDAAREKQPHAGGLFRLRPGARGVTAFAYGG